VGRRLREEAGEVTDWRGAEAGEVARRGVWWVRGCRRTGEAPRPVAGEVARRWLGASGGCGRAVRECAWVRGCGRMRVEG
jgi:hypothetical protein